MERKLRFLLRNARFSWRRRLAGVLVVDRRSTETPAGRRRHKTTAMQHSSPEAKRHYQLGMVDQVREGIERANEQHYQDEKVLRFHDGTFKPEKEAAHKHVCG